MTDNAPTSIIHVLDEDRGLGSALARDDLAEARTHAVAQVHKVARGSYSPKALFPHRRGQIGALVLSGLLLRRVIVAGRASAELVGPGALLRPWDQVAEGSPSPFEIRWTVLAPCRVALLEQRWLAVMARWPTLSEALLARADERAQRLAISMSILSLRHVELRLLVLFWHLADRFGRVTPDGVHLPLRLRHSDLAELIGAQRPTVSESVVRLERSGALRRRHDRTWVLVGDPPHQLEDISRSRGVAPRRARA